MTLLYIASGGAIGAVLRYMFTIGSGHIFGVNFPYGTFIVNIIGSFLMGIVVGYLAKTLPHSMDLRAFLVIGLLGGFTTFSSFSLDVVVLFERGELLNATIYVAFSVIIAILALFAGLYVMRQF